MTVSQMRDRVLHAYGSGFGTWANKVRKMSDRQVIAIYNRLLEQNPTKLQTIGGATCKNG